MSESILVAEMSEKELLEERAEVLQRLEDLRAGRSREGTIREMQLRLERIERLFQPEKTELN